MNVYSFTFLEGGPSHGVHHIWRDLCLKTPALRNVYHMTRITSSHESCITWSHVYVHFSHWSLKENRGSAVVAGIVQVHIKFQFYVPQSAQTCSCSESLMVIVVNGVVYFDNSVVFGYSVGW